jgi:hypothetical protein
MYLYRRIKEYQGTQEIRSTRTKRSLGLVHQTTHMKHCYLIESTIKKLTSFGGYDYIATHVDNIILAAGDPCSYMDDIEQECALWNKLESPSYY